MAVIYKTMNGKQMEKALAILPGVQAKLDDVALNIAARAEHNLQQAEVRTGVAHIEILNAGVKKRDRYVLLVDSNITNDEDATSNSALSIEFGRQPYKDPETGEMKGGMEGLFVLTQAANLHGVRGRKAKAPRMRRKRGPRKRRGD